MIAGIPENRRYESMHVVSRRGRVRSGGDAMIAMDLLFPETRKQARLARVLPSRRREVRATYEAIAARRSELSERVPDIEAIVVEPRVVGR